MLLKIRTSIRTHVSILRVNFQLQNHRDRADINRCTERTTERPFLGECLHKKSLFITRRRKQKWTHKTRIKHTLSLSLPRPNNKDKDTKIHRSFSLRSDSKTLQRAHKTDQNSYQIARKIRSNFRSFLSLSTRCLEPQNCYIRTQKTI